MNDSYLRPQSTSPTYPPYHQGEYLEEYFPEFVRDDANTEENTKKVLH